MSGSIVSIYKNIFDKSSKYTILVTEALNRIKVGKSDKAIIALRQESNKAVQDNLKKQLPSVTFSGTFSAREDSRIITYSGFICLDFDNVDIDTYKDIFEKWEFTYATWISPRGNGRKVLVKISDGKKHREHFAALKKRYPEVDEQCVNESRVCYESYDPNIYINENSEVFKEAIKHEVVLKTHVANDTFEVYKKLNRWLEKKGNIFNSGNRNRYIFILAGGCCRAGLGEDEVSSMLSSDYSGSDFTAKEIANTVKSAFRSNRSMAGSLEFRNDSFYSNETTYEIDSRVLEDGYKPADVVYGSDVYDAALDIFSNGYKSAETTHIPILDTYFKFKKGEITLLSGIGNAGKSTYLNQLLLIQSYFSEKKWAIFSPENYPAHEFYFDLTEVLLGCRCDSNAYHKPDQKLFEAAYEFVSKHFFYVYPESILPTPDYLKVKFMELIMKEKVEGIVIDPFNQLENNYGGGRSDKYLESFLSDSRRFAIENNIYYILVAHPHKLRKENGAKDYPCPDVFEIADGAMWNNKCDNIIIYHRPYAQSDPDNPVCEHHSKKIRRQKIVGKKGWFSFEMSRHKRRFYFDGINPLDGNRFESVTPEQENPFVSKPSIISDIFSENNKEEDHPW